MVLESCGCHLESLSRAHTLCPGCSWLTGGSSLGAALGHRGLLSPKVMLFPGDSWKPVVLSQPGRTLGDPPSPEMPHEQQGLSSKSCVGWLPSTMMPSSLPYRVTFQENPLLHVALSGVHFQGVQSKTVAQCPLPPFL